MYDDYRTISLHLILPNTNVYVKDYDEKINWIYFLIKNDNLLNKYNTIWDKISTDAKVELNGIPVYNKTFFKTKTKVCGDEATDFHDKELHKVNSSFTCLVVMSLDHLILFLGCIKNIIWKCF